MRGGRFLAGRQQRQALHVGVERIGQPFGHHCAGDLSRVGNAAVHRQHEGTHPPRFTIAAGQRRLKLALGLGNLSGDAERHRIAHPRGRIRWIEAKRGLIISLRLLLLPGQIIGKGAVGQMALRLFAKRRRRVEIRSSLNRLLERDLHDG